MENWRDVVGYEGLYQVSDKGNPKPMVVISGGINKIGGDIDSPPFSVR